MKKGKILLLIGILVIAILLVFLFLRTGIFQKFKIDEKDLNYWNYSGEMQQNSEEFILPGSNQTCWYLIHGYASGPDEMRELASELNKEFNETVIVARLKGHGKVPSEILGLTLGDWYFQVEQEYDNLKNNCEKINLVGFSFGGALSARLSENRNVNHIYLLAPYIFATYKFYRIVSLEFYLDIFAEIFLYGKKTKIAQINDPTGMSKHVAYWNMPFVQIKYSKYFLEKTKKDLSQINSPILLQHSKGDKTSDLKSSKYIYENINSLEKELIIFEKSNHVLTRDYDKKEVIDNIINFEKRSREY